MSLSPAGYLIVLARIEDRAKFGAYVAALPPVYHYFGGSYLCVSPQATQRWAATPANPGVPHPAHALVISRWPTMARLTEFWHSAQYQAVAQLRAGTGQFWVSALAGVAEITALPSLALSIDAPAPPHAQLLAEGVITVLEGPPIGETLQLFALAQAVAASPAHGRWFLAQ
jgi:uncharacterized protein (DUF1330 family)